jgi:PRC-barrel domain protein
MRQMIIHSVAGFLLLAGPSVAFAECTIGDAKSEQELAKIEGIRSGEYGTIRRDMRSLRSAAAVLDRYGKDEACQEVVAAINELLRDPKAASELRSKSMMKTFEEHAATTETKTEDQAATETKTDEQATTKTKTETTAPALAPVVTMEQRREGAVGFSERKSAMSSAELIGSDVYGADNDSIGEIDDVVVSSDNRPAYVLISYGGFLGIGEEQAAVPVSAIKVSEDNYYFVNLNAEQLKAAPKLKRGTSDWWTNASWRDENDAYYKNIN